MTADYRNLHGTSAVAGNIGPECLGAEGIKKGYSEELSGIVSNAGFLKNLCCQRNHGVYRIGNNRNAGLGSVLCHSLHQPLDNLGIDVE